MVRSYTQTRLVSVDGFIPAGVNIFVGQAYTVKTQKQSKQIDTPSTYNHIFVN